MPKDNSARSRSEVINEALAGELVRETRGTTETPDQPQQRQRAGPQSQEETDHDIRVVGGQQQ